MTAGLIQTVERFSNICPYFDIPIQHASDNLLRRMGRGYNRTDLLRLFESIRAKIPHAALRTTVLVGFPGETETDIDLLAQLMAQVRFDHLGVFAYSDADDLPSHHLGSHVEPRTAQARLDRLMELQKEISEENLARMDGRVVPVLVEKEAEPGIYAARSKLQAPEVDGSVLIRSDHALQPGTRVSVTIVETHAYDLVGEIG